MASKRFSAAERSRWRVESSGTEGSVQCGHFMEVCVLNAALTCPLNVTVQSPILTIICPTEAAALLRDPQNDASEGREHM